MAIFLVVVKVFDDFFEDNAIDVLQVTNSGLGFTEVA